MIRAEIAVDEASIRKVNEAAFGGRDEADLMERLRAEGAVLLSLVAVEDGEIRGHILFSRMWIDTEAGALEAAALAPMAVLPEYQRSGIGGKLIREGLRLLQDERIVIVVGHANYYPRFGFSTALASGLESPFPREVFMALELQPGALEGVRGKVRYAEAFGIG